MLEELKPTVDLFLSVIDKTISLVTLRAEAKRRMFKETVEPVFDSLKPVVDQYLKFFRKASSVIKNASDEDLQGAIKDLHTFRNENWTVRVGVESYARSLKKISDRPIVEFADSVLRLFGATKETPRFSQQRDSIELLDRVLDGKVDRVFAAKDLDTIIEQIEQHWIEVAERYKDAAIAATK